MRLDSDALKAARQARVVSGEKQMNEKLSSSVTFYHKVLLPFLWITGFGAGTLAMWLGKFSQPSQPPDNVKLMFLIVWVLGSLFMLIDTIRLKTISLDKDVLVIKNFSRVIQVPLRNVRRISESRLMRPKTITLTVYPPSEFGEKITFIPQAKFQAIFNIWSEHPIVIKLRELTGAQD